MGFLKRNSINDLRLQLDGTSMLTDMALGSNNLFVALADHKSAVGMEREFHIATYFGVESASNYRSYLKSPIGQIVGSVKHGVMIGPYHYQFRLLVSCDYVALAKLMGCGYHTGNYRCAICYYDVRQPGKLFTP